MDRVKRKIRRTLNDSGVLPGLISNRQPGEKYLNAWPVQSPYENTRNIYSELSKIMPTFLYHLTEKVHCQFLTNDIFLGHPYFPHIDGKFGVTELAFQEKIKPKTLALITPLHCDTSIKTHHINKAYLEDIDKLISKTDILFAIMGEYWWDRWDVSQFSHWKPKMIRLDMAVDIQKYPKIKNKFNKPGQRGYIFIAGSADPRKGANIFSDLMGKIGNYPRGWIGNGPDIPNVPRISKARALTPEFMANLADKFDFFVSPAVADPNPTTILESMAWGFPVICTPQSGYYETPYRKNIHLNDIEKNIRVLRQLQFSDETELDRMANLARRVVETDYTWKKITDRIIQSLKLRS